MTQVPLTKPVAKRKALDTLTQTVAKINVPGWGLGGVNPRAGTISEGMASRWHPYPNPLLHGSRWTRLPKHVAKLHVPGWRLGGVKPRAGTVSEDMVNHWHMYLSC